MDSEVEKLVKEFKIMYWDSDLSEIGFIKMAEFHLYELRKAELRARLDQALEDKLHSIPYNEIVDKLTKQLEQLERE